MATINLLSGSFNGKLGSLYGTKEYGKRFIKAIPFAHAPHNRTQTNCVRAFEILNRISAKVAKDYFYHLPLSSKKMSKMNAVAQFFKPLIKNHVFEGQNIQEVFGDEATFQVTNISFDILEKQVVVEVENIKDMQGFTDNCYYVGLFSEEGFVVASELKYANSFRSQLAYDALWFENMMLFVLRTAKLNGKIVLLSAFFDTPASSPVVAGVFYTSRINFVSTPIYENEVITFPQENSSISGETIIITG